MNLDYIGARPSKVTEWTSASVRVFVFDVSFVLLNPSEHNVTRCTNRPRLAAAHCTSLIICDVLDSEMS